MMEEVDIGHVKAPYNYTYKCRFYAPFENSLVGIV